MIPLLLAAVALAQTQTQTPRAELTLALRITRTDAAPAPETVLGLPTLKTLDGTTSSIQVAGGDLGYSISVAPTLEKAENGGTRNVSLLWNVQFNGKSLPGASSVTLTGAGRVAVDKEESMTEITLRDPKTNRTAIFRVQVKTALSPDVK